MKKDFPQGGSQKKIYLILPYFLLIFAAFLVYSNSFDGQFQFDDAANITKQPIIKDLNNFSDLDLWTNINFRPLSMFTFALNYNLNGFDVTGYHIFNLIIHILCGFLVFLLMKKILSIYWKKDESNSDITLISLFISLVFVLHPIQTQSVTYIVQRMTALSGLFYLLAVYLYIVARRKHVQRGSALTSILYYLLVILVGVLSLLSKQIAVTLPLALLLVEICFIRSKEGKVYKKFVLLSLSVIILLVVIVAVTGNLPRETDKISRTDYFVTQFRVMTKYIQLLILPINQNLDYAIRPATTFWHFKEIASFLFLSFLIFLSIYFYKRNKLITFGIIWFFVTLALESSIIPIRGLIYEHRLYLALMGFSTVLVTVVYRVTKKRKELFILILSIIIIIYGFATFQRNKVWKNRFTLWSDILKKSPQKARSHYYMGIILSDSGQKRRAINFYLKAIKLRPGYVDALVSLGNVLKSLGKNTKAVQYYKNALKYDPQSTAALNNLGVIVSDRGEYEKAITYYNKILKIEPHNAEAMNNLGIIWGRKKNYSKAMQYFKKALSIRPQYATARKNLQLIENYLKQQNFEE